MKYNYIIIEDLPQIADSLKFELDKFVDYQHKGIAINIDQAIALISKTKPHLLFLDIELGIESGFDLIPQLIKNNIPIPFMIVTSRITDYAMQSFDIDAIYFINKPYIRSKIEVALAKFEEKQKQQNTTLFLSNSNGKNQINLDHIYFIEAQGSYIQIFTTKNEVLKFSKNLKQIQQLLPKHFIRIHNSYIINQKHLQAIKDQKAYLTPLPISHLIPNINQASTNGIPISDTYFANIRN